MSRTRFDLNQATVIGRIGQEPQYRETERAKILTFSVATTERLGQDREERTTWFNVVSFGDNGEFLSNALAKGDRVSVVGRLELDEFTRKDGTAGTSLKLVADTVVPLTDKRNGSSQPARQQQREQPEELPWE